MAIEGNKQVGQSNAPTYLDIKAMQAIHRQQQVYGKLNPEIFARYANLPNTVEFVFTKDTGKGSA